MDWQFKLLLILHFFGLAMGLSVGLSNMVMMALISKASGPDQAVLSRFPPAMMRVGDIGLSLLWASGLAMLFTRYGGFAGLSAFGWTLHVKLTAVVILTGLVGYMHGLIRKARNGDKAAAAMLPKIGRVAFLMAVTAIVFAVATFG
jgi:hypothetical protein